MGRARSCGSRRGGRGADWRGGSLISNRKIHWGLVPAQLRAIKERAKLVRQLKELEDYERDVLHPLAGQRIEIDLDDGVKANYPKFGKALRKIPGLE